MSISYYPNPLLGQLQGNIWSKITGRWILIVSTMSPTLGIHIPNTFKIYRNSWRFWTLTLGLSMNHLIMLSRICWRNYLKSYLLLRFVIRVLKLMIWPCNLARYNSRRRVLSVLKLLIMGLGMEIRMEMETVMKMKALIARNDKWKDIKLVSEILDLVDCNYKLTIKLL